jgi:hypothetical protein
MRRALAVLPLLALLAACGVGPEKTVTIKVPLHTKGNLDCTTSDTATVKLTDDKDFDKYKGALEKAELIAARVVITGVDAENAATTGTGSATFTASDGTEVTLLAYEVPIVDGTVKTVEFDKDAAAKLVAAVTKAPYEIKMTTVGSGDAPKCRFSFRVELDFKLTAKLTALL